MKSVATSPGTEIELEDSTCYTDSEVSLYWIQGNDRVWKQTSREKVAQVTLHELMYS